MRGEYSFFIATNLWLKWSWYDPSVDTLAQTHYIALMGVPFMLSPNAFYMHRRNVEDRNRRSKAVTSFCTGVERSRRDEAR